MISKEILEKVLSDEKQNAQAQAERYSSAQFLNSDPQGLRTFSEGRAVNRAMSRVAAKLEELTGVKLDLSSVSPETRRQGPPPPPEERNPNVDISGR